MKYQLISVMIMAAFFGTSTFAQTLNKNYLQRESQIEKPIFGDGSFNVNKKASTFRTTHNKKMEPNYFEEKMKKEMLDKKRFNSGPDVSGGGQPTQRKQLSSSVRALGSVARGLLPQRCRTLLLLDAPRW